jgi:hypothetical protein
VCNWLVSAEAESGALCLACHHNRTVPDLSAPANLGAWRLIEFAKHRLIYSLLRLELPLTTREDDPDHGLAFDFLADPPPQSGPKIMTGHDNGLITIALAEADDATREKRRLEMGEPYRTLLGHFRHESGHHYWDLLVRDAGRLEEFRAVFGDEREDYSAALGRYYENGSPADWQDAFVSAYATAHPWEDFAESWAHYLHIVDTLEMADAFGIRIRPKVDKKGALVSEVNFDPYRAGEVENLIEAWLPLTFAVNSLNRCMGERDLYPFILSPTAVRKLGFIHALVHAKGSDNSRPNS